MKCSTKTIKYKDKKAKQNRENKNCNILSTENEQYEPYIYTKKTTINSELVIFPII